MYLGLMRFPCSVNELLRIHSHIDTRAHARTHARPRVYLSFLYGPRYAFQPIIFPRWSARLFLNRLRRVNNSTPVANCRASIIISNYNDVS